MGYKKQRWELGPNPDPEKWQDVQTKDGWMRRKRKAKQSKLNDVMQRHADSFKVTMPAAKRILDRLEPWVRGLDLGRIQAEIGTRLKKSYLENGKMNFTYLLDLDLQPGRKLNALLSNHPKVWVKDEVVVKIWLTDELIKLKKSIFTDYYFELIMVWGEPPNPLKGELNPTKRYKGLKVDSEESKLYKRRDPKGPVKDDELCVLKIDVPKTKLPWMALLKVSCLEGNELAHNPRHYAMKVVAVGTP